MDAILQLSQVTKVYGQGDVKVKALRGINLELKEGEFTAMAGPSGSGKSTLLNIVGALDRATSGSIRVDGHNLSTLSNTMLSALRRNRIGFVFQNFNLIPVLTAYENAEYVLMLQKVPPHLRREKVLRLLAEVGLKGMENRFPRELSGGQQQRVAIARAIVSEPALVLADEPTANVDSETAFSLINLMERMNLEKRVTFLFSTHDHSVMKRAQRIILLKDGAIAYDGSPADL
ncbi:MAG: ABC transporter ATP-binding protein [bacterium]